jgi:hypothetical protein
MENTTGESLIVSVKVPGTGIQKIRIPPGGKIVVKTSVTNAAVQRIRAALRESGGIVNMNVLGSIVRGFGQLLPAEFWPTLSAALSRFREQMTPENIDEILGSLPTDWFSNEITNIGDFPVEVLREGMENKPENWDVIEPGEGLVVLPDGSATPKRYTPDELNALRDKIQQAAQTGAGTGEPVVIPPTPPPAKPGTGAVNEQSIIPPVETAFKDPGYIEVQKEASPYKP